MVIRRELPAVLEALKVRTLLDAPCGDLNWITRVDLPVQRYVGVDIVEELIAANRARYGSRARRFRVANVVCDRLPKCDAVLCRDCFIHLPTSDIRSAIENFKRSGATYLLATTHPGVTENVDIPAGAWRSVDLEKPPFALPPPIRRIVENADTSKSLGVWRLADLLG
ncbi:MAG TPA: class I SAM-dependent methyltransferase [Candidatus Kryptonia bacterium]|nr:class I SAM-dependent methyltransferase [Candidatus Kryptonia bacterium]